MDYNFMREFADSWGLIFLMAVFAAAVLFVFRPGAAKKYQEYAKIPLKDDED